MSDSRQKLLSFVRRTPNCTAEMVWQQFEEMDREEADLFLNHLVALQLLARQKKRSPEFDIITLLPEGRIRLEEACQKETNDNRRRTEANRLEAKRKAETSRLESDRKAEMDRWEVNRRAETDRLEARRAEERREDKAEAKQNKRRERIFQVILALVSFALGLMADQFGGLIRFLCAALR